MTKTRVAQTSPENRSLSHRASRLFWATIGGSILALLVLCAALAIIAAQRSS